MKLFPYQNHGVDFLCAPKKFRLLADEMGLGKTAQTIRALDKLKAKKVLIIAPAIARLTWVKEVVKWTESGLQCVSITNTKEVAEFLSRPSVCGVVSFDFVVRNPDTFRGVDFDALIVDEAHYLKNSDAKRTLAVIGSNGIIHRAKRTWFLTGTPMPNHPQELWAMLYVSKATNLNKKAFTEKFCEYYFDGYSLRVTGAKRNMMPTLRESLNTVMLRRTKKDIFGETPRFRVTEMPIDVDWKKIPPELKADWDKLVKATNQMGLQGGLGALDILASLATSVSSVRRFMAVSKVDAVVKQIEEELENKEYKKIIVFASHIDAVKSIGEKLRRFGSVVISGETPPESRQAMVERFQNDDSCRVFVGNIVAAGTNITLTAASEIVFLEQDWVPANNMQAIARADRIGQTEFLNVRVAMVADSIDEAIQGALIRKTGDINALMK